MQAAKAKNSRLPGFGGRLHSAIMAADRSDLAADLGVTYRTLSLWVRGDYEPRVADLEYLARTLKVSADWLLGLTDDPTPRSSKEPSE